MSLDPRTPVLVGVGQYTHTDGDAPEPVDLLVTAARSAARDSGAPRIIGALDSVRIVSIFTRRYPDPGALVAERLGADPRQTVYTCSGGQVPQWLINETAAEIQAGEVDVVLIGGAESWKTRNAAKRAGRTLGWTNQSADAAPTRVFGEEFPAYSDEETAHGLDNAPAVYALFENALRARDCLTATGQRDRLGRLWSRFNAVAAANPHAAVRRASTAEDISTPGPGNRMVASPYPKLLCSNSNVDQAAAVLMCSVESARSLGVPADRWVFPHGGATGSDTGFISHRDRFDASAALRLVGTAALDVADRGIDDIRHIDLYSCFPAAVQIAARELGLGADRDLTVTGGLTFAGGPWNNYTTHAVATMVALLREQPGEFGLCSGNGGMLTKHAFGVYSTDPPARGARVRSVQRECERLPRRACAEGYEGTATIETYTVTHDRDGAPARGHLACLTPEGARAWASTEDTDLLASMVADDHHGRTVKILAGRPADIS